MADTITKITTTDHKGKPLEIEVTAEETDIAQDGNTVWILQVVLLVNGQSVGIINFDPATDQLSISGLSFGVPSYVVCLTTCGLGHLVSDILDCRRRGHNTSGALLKCLASKGHTLSFNLINCAVACIASLGGGSSTP